MPETATYRDVILCIRADEIGHREYNHLFADIHGKDERMVSERLEILNQPEKEDKEVESPNSRKNNQKN